MSPSTADVDKGVKKELYERTFHTADYYVYNPFEPTSLQGWHLNDSQRYQPLGANTRGWLWCQTLELWLGTWSGSIQREPPNGTCQWLRFYDRQENLVLLPRELAQQERQRAQTAQQQAEQERQRAERLAVRLRDLGEDPNTI